MYRWTVIMTLMLLPGVGQADLHVQSRVTTSSGDSFKVEQWIGKNHGTRRIGQQVYIADLQRKSLLLIDHDQRTVTAYDLIDPKPLGAYDFIIEPTDRTDTLGEWTIEEFHITNPNRPSVDYYVWSTRDISGVSTHQYFNFVRRLPSGEDFTVALKEIYGFPVKIVTVIKNNDSTETVESVVVSLQNDQPPEGTYEAPRAYRRQ